MNFLSTVCTNDPCMYFVVNTQFFCILLSTTYNPLLLEKRREVVWKAVTVQEVTAGPELDNSGRSQKMDGHVGDDDL